MQFRNVISGNLLSHQPNCEEGLIDLTPSEPLRRIEITLFASRSVALEALIIFHLNFHGKKSESRVFTFRAALVCLLDAKVNEWEKSLPNAADVVPYLTQYLHSSVRMEERNAVFHAIDALSWLNWTNSCETCLWKGKHECKTNNDKRDSFNASSCIDFGLIIWWV